MRRLHHQLIELYLGGAGIGAYYLQKEVPAGVEWDNPENRMIFSSGPLGGQEYQEPVLFH